jgi:hypothetical protein
MGKMTKIQKVWVIGGFILFLIILIVQMVTIGNLQKTITLYGKNHVTYDDLGMATNTILNRVDCEYDERIEKLESQNQGCPDIHFMRADPYCQVFYTAPGCIDSIIYRVIFTRK